MVPPRSPSASRFCRPSSLIHSVIRPTTGSSALAELGRARRFEAGGVPRRFDAGHLHAEADAEEGDVALAGEMDAGDLALAAALAEAAGDEDGVHRLELGGDLGLGMLEQFARRASGC